MNPCSGVDRGQSFAEVSVSTLLESAATPSDTSVTTRAFRALRTYFPLRDHPQAQASASTAIGQRWNRSPAAFPTLEMSTWTSPAPESCNQHILPKCSARHGRIYAKASASSAMGT